MVLKGHIFDLSGVVELDHVEGLEDVAHLVLAVLSVGVVPGLEGGNLLADGVVVAVLLSGGSVTIELILLSSIFCCTVCSTRLWCRRIDPLYF